MAAVELGVNESSKQDTRSINDICQLPLDEDSNPHLLSSNKLEKFQSFYISLLLSSSPPVLPVIARYPFFTPSNTRR